MKRLSRNNFNVLLSISVFLVSVFMSISYYLKISNNEADSLTMFAFYVWIVSIFIWLIKALFELNICRRRVKNEQNEQ